jgi:hypothetical protein
MRFDAHDKEGEEVRHAVGHAFIPLADYLTVY